ncbi:hypothetical protein [Sandaracinus amylolyticus]|uniref:hypothetical protein n=1 Tax=Sandaracinus amylolyticus TaxID=927083 RepID=UPI001F472477|nr:hypothetical protein [Sandaracinus amylolyticus]UJR78238.1 Hypothetical protein I5071_2650 [Sandaracinus amylolyticus]
MSWSGDNHRTPDRRFIAALRVDETGGWGDTLFVAGVYVVMDTCSARVLGTIGYAWHDGEPTTRLELDVERTEDGSEQIVGRTIALGFGLDEQVVATHAFAAPASDEIGEPPRGPHLSFALDEPLVTRAQLVNAVDALRGRLTQSFAKELFGRDPTTVRLVSGDRIVVELSGAREDAILAELALDRPAILEIPPFDVLVERTNLLSPPEMMQLRIRATCEEPVPDVVHVAIDGIALGAVTSATIPRGRGHVNLPPPPVDRELYNRLVRYPLRGRVRRVAT